jgi:hypothetical protein
MRSGSNPDCLFMDDHARLTPTSAYVVLAVNLVLLAVLAWHIAFEAVPQTLVDFHAARHIGRKAFSLFVLLPYAVLVAFLLMSWQRSVFRWRTAAFIVCAVAAYAVAVIAMGLYIGRNFFPT